MKKLLSVLSSTLQGGLRGGLLILALLATTSLWAYDFQSGDLYYNITSDTVPYTVEVTYQYKGSNLNYSGLTTVEFPASVIYDGITYDVTSIGENAFANHSTLISVTIGNNVTSIGKNAFSSIYSLDSVIIGNSVTSIEGGAFQSCHALSSVTIGNSVTSIGGSAFYYCKSLTSITIPNSVTSIGNYAFSWCYELSSISIGDSVTSIGSEAFESTKVYQNKSYWENGKVLYIDNYLIKAIGISGDYTIKDSTRVIANDAFSECSSLNSITIPNSVISIGSYAFYKCPALSSITMSENITRIENYTFSYCSALTSVTIPENVMSIGNYSFSDCSALTSITIPENVTSIGEYAFSDCSALTSITIPKNVTHIGTNAFAGCSDITSIVWEAICCGDNPFYSLRSQITSFTFGDNVECIPGQLCYGMDKLESIVISNSVTSIGWYAFYGCSSLTSVTIGASVTSINYDSFFSCPSLTSVVWNATNYTGRAGDVFNDNLASQITSFTFGDSVEYIPASLCYNMDNITDINIPNSVDSIGVAAFQSCDALSSVTIGDSVTSIGDYAFYDCSSLTSVSIGNSVTNIGGSAFGYCSSLTSITIPNSVTSIGGGAFGYCSSLTSITIPNSVTSIGDWAFSSCSSLTSITIPNSVTSIGDDAFYGCSSISSITLAAPTIEVFCQGQTNQLLKDNYYLQVDRKIQINGNNVTNIVIPESVDSIKSYAFYMCQISSVEIGDAVTGIGKGAFYSCSSLTSATIGDGVTNISVSAFRNCSSLTSITIPNSVTSIEGGAFRNCSSLTSITIPNSVTSIGEEAFTDCSSLTSVVWNATNYENITETSNSPFGRVVSQITSFTFGDSVKSIPAYLCRGMTNLQYIVIPNSVDSVKYYAFNGCSSLKSVRIGEGLKYIDRRAFYECTAIESVEWNAINCNVKFYENDVNPMLFYYSREQISSFAFGDNVEFIPQRLCYGMDKLKSIVIPNSVTNIGNSAFSGCSSLTSITIPESVTSIGENAFGGSTASLLVTLKIKSIEDYMQRKVNDQLYEASLKLPKRILSINDAYEIIDIIVPENIDSISDYAFYNCYHIRSISLHDTNKYLGEYALSGCTSLTSIQLPYNIEGLTKTSLPNSYSIQSITITAPSIEEYCQSYINSNLYDYGFAESAKRNIVINGQAVTDLVIPEPVTTIGERVFYNCTTLTSLTLPKHVESIERSAFYGCEALESIYQKSMTPPAVQSDALSSYPVCYVPYGSLSAYENSAWAKQVSHFVEEPLRGYKIYYTTSNGQIINPSISDPFDAAIMSNVYENGQGVIAFEGPVSTIKAGAFSNCSNLTSITIPVSIKQIENQAFANCSALGVVDVKCITPPVVGNEVFTSAPTCYIPCGTKYLFENSAWSDQVGEFIAEECGGNKIFYTTIDGDIITPSETVDFGAKMISNVYEFGQGIMTFDGPVTHMAGFSNCKTLTSITIPESVTTVESSCFGSCSLLTSIVWNAKHVEQVRWGGGSWLGASLPIYDLFGGVRSQITSFVFGDNVEYIPDHLCYYMENLTSVVIPESVQNIGTYAFSRCSALTSAVIGNNVKTIGEHAFSYCSSLTSTTIGKSVITIGEEAFRDCSALTSIVIPDSVLAIENSTFFNCSALTSVTLNNSLISIYDYAFMDCSSLTSITIPEDVTYIGDRVFYDCSALTSITWNARHCNDFLSYDSYSDVYKPEQKFEGCSITSFIISENVEKLPASLCYKMSDLQSITIPEKVNMIGDYTFNGCTSLTSITIPENVYSIGASAFNGCSSLTSITLPENLYSMGERAFNGCSSLTSITIPENVSSIGGYAFSYCSSLKTVAWNAINTGDILNSNSYTCTPFSSSPIETLVIGDKVTYIPERFCEECSTLASVTIGKNVREIGYYAFYNCTSLTQTNYTGNIASWCQIDFSYMSNPTSYSKNLFINGEEVTDVLIPNTVSSISSYAFNNCEKISSLTISESVKSIGYNAFGGCKKLFDIYCYPTTPPEAQENSFTNYNVNLYVPCESLKDYQMDVVFGSFKYIQCLEEDIPSVPQDTTIYHPTEEVIICEGDVFEWYSYEFGYYFGSYSDEGTHEYVLIEETEEYIYHHIFTLVLTVQPSETVVLVEEAYDSYEWHGVVYTESGSYFYEEWCYQEILELTIIPSTETAVDNMQTDSDHSAQKILRDQQILILRDGKTYTIMGAEVK